MCIMCAIKQQIPHQHFRLYSNLFSKGYAAGEDQFFSKLQYSQHRTATHKKDTHGARGKYQYSDGINVWTLFHGE